MITKKAQAGTAITWFIGFLVVAFIIFIFFFLGFATTVMKQTVEGKPEITRPDQEGLYKSEQQRNLFNLIEYKENYEVIKQLILELKEITPEDGFKGPYNGYIGDNYVLLNKTLKEYHGLFNQEHYWISINNQRTLRFSLNDKGPNQECWMFLILDKERRGPFYRESAFHFIPSDISIQRGQTDSNLLVFAYPLAYSFIIPEKPFALIKYVKTYCPYKN